MDLLLTDAFIHGFQVTGDSVYNLVRLGEIETGKADRPLDPPPRILSVEVAIHMFLKASLNFES